jgi:hypothetical protein
VPGLTIVGSSGNNTIHLSDPSDTGVSDGGNTTFVVDAAAAGALITATAGRTTLRITGTVALDTYLNAGDSGAIDVVVDPGLNLGTNADPGLTIDATAGDDSIFLGGPHQTVLAGAGDYILDSIVPLGGFTTVRGTAAQLTGSNIGGLVSTDTIDATNIKYQRAVLTQGASGGGLSATVTLSDGTHTAQFTANPKQVFRIAPDGSGGTDILQSVAYPATASTTASITAGSLLLAPPRFISAAGNASPPEVVLAAPAGAGPVVEPAADPLGAPGTFGATAHAAVGVLAGGVLSDLSIPGPIVPTNPNNESVAAGGVGSGGVAILPPAASVVIGHGTP